MKGKQCPSYLKQSIVSGHGDVLGVKHESLCQKTEQVVWRHGILLSSAHDDKKSKTKQKHHEFKIVYIEIVKWSCKMNISSDQYHQG